MKWFYELLYGHFRAPWDLGPRKELVDVVKSATRMDDTDLSALYEYIKKAP